MKRYSGRAGDENDPLRDFEEIEDHRYDPGYWTTSWYSRARPTPPYGYISPDNMPAGLRAAILDLFATGISYGLFGRFLRDIPYFWWWMGGYASILYIVLLVLVKRSMAKNLIKRARR